MENIEVDGTPFSIHMDRAVKIKCMQSKRDRVKYDAFPEFYANTIYPNDDVLAARRLHTFQEQLDAASRMKEAGNEAFRNGCFHDAVTKYGMAVSVFRYLEITNPEWKSQGIIEDRFIQEIEYECNDEAECHNLNQLLSNCYTNIALASCKLKDYPLAMQACDYAISVNGRNDKAYFSRARARLSLKRSGLVDQQLARSDLLMASKLNPENSEAKVKLAMVSRVIRMQKMNDENIYKGLFDRVEIYDHQELHQSKEERRECTVKSMLDSKQRDILMGRQLAQLYNERGMYKEQERIEQSIENEIESMETLNFRNPSPKMILEAESMGINLNDPQTIELLERMKDGDRDRKRDFRVKSEETKMCSTSAFVHNFKAVEQKLFTILSVTFIAVWILSSVLKLS